MNVLSWGEADFSLFLMWLPSRLSPVCWGKHLSRGSAESSEAPRLCAGPLTGSPLRPPRLGPPGARCPPPPCWGFDLQ